jgi:hypothetical protein
LADAEKALLVELSRRIAASLKETG